MRCQQEISGKGRQYRLVCRPPAKDLRVNQRPVCGEEPLNRQWRQVVVTHLVWWHGSVVAYIHSAHVFKAVTNALRKIPVLSNHSKTHRPKQADIQFLEQELRYPGSTIVLVQRHSTTRESSTAWYRARVEKINYIRCAASVTLVDVGDFLVNVPWANLYSACVLEKPLRLAPGATPCLLQGFHPSCFQLANPECLRDHEMWRSLNTTCWREEAIYEPHESQEIQLRSAHLICANNGLSFEQMFSHILLGVTCLWRPNLLSSSSRVLRKQEEVEVIMVRGDQINVRISRFPLEELARLQSELSQLARDGLLAPFPWFFQSEQGQHSEHERLVALPWGNGWQRGEVLSLWPSTRKNGIQDTPRAQVWLIDLGFSTAMPAKNLRVLPVELADRLPRFGLNVTLHCEPAAEVPDSVTLDSIKLNPSSRTASAVLACNRGRGGLQMLLNDKRMIKPNERALRPSLGELFTRTTDRLAAMSSSLAIVPSKENVLRANVLIDKTRTAYPLDSCAVWRDADSNGIHVLKVVSIFSRSSAVVLDVRAQSMVSEALNGVDISKLTPVDPREIGITTVVLAVGPEVGSKLIRGIPETITRFSSQHVSVTLLNLDGGSKRFPGDLYVTVSEMYECPPELRVLRPGRCKLHLDEPPFTPFVVGEQVMIQESGIDSSIIYGSMVKRTGAMNSRPSPATTSGHQA